MGEGDEEIKEDFVTEKGVEVASADRSDDSGIQIEQEVEVVSTSHNSIIIDKAFGTKKTAHEKRHYLNVAPKRPTDVNEKGAQPSVKKNERHYLNVAPKLPIVSKPVRISPRLNKGKPAKKFGFDN